MRGLSASFVAIVFLATAGAASASDARPTTTDAARVLAGQRQAVASPAWSCGRMPTSTDEARAEAGARPLAPSAAVARAAARTPTTTDEVRALAAGETTARGSAPEVRHADACATSCACHGGEQHARNASSPCGCRHET